MAARERVREGIYRRALTNGQTVHEAMYRDSRGALRRQVAWGTDAKGRSAGDAGRNGHASLGGSDSSWSSRARVWQTSSETPARCAMRASVRPPTPRASPARFVPTGRLGRASEARLCQGGAVSA